MQRNINLLPVDQNYKRQYKEHIGNEDGAQDGGDGLLSREKKLFMF